MPMIAASQITSDEHRSNVRASLHELTQARVERFGLNRVLIRPISFPFFEKPAFDYYVSSLLRECRMVFDDDR